MENNWTPNKRVVNQELREEAMESALLSTIPFVAGEQYLFCHQVATLLAELDVMTAHVCFRVTASIWLPLTK